MLCVVYNDKHVRTGIGAIPGHEGESVDTGASVNSIFSDYSSGPSTGNWDVRYPFSLSHKHINT